MQSNYTVQIEDFAKRHFIKSFEKKHISHWDVTLVGIIAELERIDALLLTDRAETICDSGDIKIIKTKFRIATIKESAKTSGNRCIVAWNTENRSVSILLVYGKTDLSSSNNETAEWKNLIRRNYPEYSKIL